MMAKAIRLTRTGGPDVLDYVDVEVGEPITAVQLAGTGLVLVGIYMLSLKK